MLYEVITGCRAAALGLAASVYQSNVLAPLPSRFRAERCFVILQRFNKKLPNSMTLMVPRIRIWTTSCALAAALLAGGCATNGDPRDPLEPMNRAIYHFNDGLDHLLLKPAAELS